MSYKPVLLLVLMLGDWHTDKMNSSFTCPIVELLSNNSKNKSPSRCFSNDLDGSTCVDRSGEK